MEFLRVLEGIRTPPVDKFMAAITYVGDETVFMVLALLLFWCVSKRQGFYIFAVGFCGTIVSQWLKLVFCIPRPWVLDPNFTIVEAAREGADGYSFPSGHTQSVVGTFTGIALANRQVWLRIICVALVLIVPFSRMYLGVHTPLDVGVAFAMAVAMALALWPCFRTEGQYQRAAIPVLLSLLALCIAYTVYVTRLDPTGLDPDNLASGIKNGWSLLGCILGLLLSYLFDRMKLHFDEKAPFLGQVCKLVLGVAVLVAIRTGLKSVLSALTGGAVWANAIRYFIMVAFGGCIWPMTFPFFAKLGKKKESPAQEEAPEQQA